MDWEKNKSITYLIGILTAAVYVLVFRRVYEDCLCTVYEFYGYRLDNTDIKAQWITNILAFIPILFYKPQRKVSDFMAIVIYVIVYVPSVTAIQCYYPEYSFSIRYQLAYLFAMSLFFLSSKVRLSNYCFRKSKYAMKIKPYLLFGGIVFLLTIAIFNTSIQLVSFDDVYDIRQSGNSKADSIPLFNYLYIWMPNVLSPLFVTMGCIKKKRNLVVMGFLMALLYYMTCGMKAAVFIPILSLFLYKSLDKNDKTNFKIFPYLTLGVIVPYILFLLFDTPLVTALVGLLLMRTYGISAFLTPIYIDVFQDYPYTYYSHIGIVDKIFGMYPFQTHSLGNEVALAYGLRDAEANLNANFLVTDGIAAGGIVGIIIISIVFFFFLILMNQLTKKIRYPVAVSLVTGVSIALTNVSLFTTLLTCGMLLLLVFLRLAKINEYDKEYDKH